MLIGAASMLIIKNRAKKAAAERQDAVEPEPEPVAVGD